MKTALLLHRNDSEKSNTKFNLHPSRVAASSPQGADLAKINFKPLDDLAKQRLRGNNIAVAYAFISPDGSASLLSYKEKEATGKPNNFKVTTDQILKQAEEDLKKIYGTEAFPKGSQLVRAYLYQGRFTEKNKQPLTIFPLKRSLDISQISELENLIRKRFSIDKYEIIQNAVNVRP